MILYPQASDAAIVQVAQSSQLFGKTDGSLCQQIADADPVGDGELPSFGEFHFIVVIHRERVGVDLFARADNPRSYSFFRYQPDPFARGTPGWIGSPLDSGKSWLP